MFGRRKREEAEAEEAAREAERRALFARLAERPEHICPFLGLAGARTDYVEGISDEHRCFAFGDPAPLSAEQQTRVCQERGYGNCPRYLRGVLVIPTEELEALRRPHAPIETPPPPPASAEHEGRRRGPIAALIALVLLVAVGGAGAFFMLGMDPGTALGSPSPTAQATLAATETAAPTASPQATAVPTPSPTGALASPTPEPTPDAGDVFALYEVSVGPGESYTLYALEDAEPVDTTSTSFDGFSFAEVEPVQGADGEVYWLTLNGDLAGWAYRYPDSGDFRIRAVFFNEANERRSEYLEQDELTVFPESTPSP